MLVCGDANTGKSTFCRFIVNKLLKRYSFCFLGKKFSTFFLVRCEKVGFLECDVGQPEFTVPMVTALHLVTTPVFGPAYLNHRKPYK